MSFNVFQDLPYSPVRKMDSNLLFDQNVINGFAPVLTYAACEWFLIFLMFIDALLSYLLVWFARYCRLQMPCFLCSKLLHPLHWRLLLCRNHRTEVSSYMSCQNHGNNLADCRGMCDDCLLSFTKMTGPNPDMNRLLLGKLGYDLLSKSHFAHPRSCSCCNKPWRTRHNTQRLIRLGSRGRNSPGKPNIPAPRHLTRRGSSGSLKKMRDLHKTTTSSGAEYVDVGSRSDGMAHVGYTELKIHSDSESEFLFSDEDAFFPITIEPSEKRVHKSRRRSFEDKKLSKSKQPQFQDNNIHMEDVESSMRDLHLVDETDQRKPVQEEEHDAVLTELITMSEARPFSLVSSPHAEAATQNQNEAESSGNSSPSGGEFLSPSAENVVSRKIQIQANDDSPDSSSSAVNVEASEEAMEQKEVSDRIDEPGSVADESSSDEENGFEGDSKPSTSDNMSGSLAQEQSSEEENEVNENNVPEEYFSNEEEEDEVNGHAELLTSKDMSGSLAEEQSSEEEEDGSNGYSIAKDHSSNEEEDVDNGDSEPLTSNNVTGSATEEHSSKDEHEDHEETEPLTSPKITINKESSSLEVSDKDSSKVEEANGSPELKHSASVESFVSISSDIEGENLVDLLKQQLEHDRKCLRDLSKELEEERNASAIATNQAMAMITRLQEEKAALHMEALQYLRMMDEQAEHDVDALERANDVLADREKEIQDLEMELEYYRVKYPDEPREEILASMGILDNIQTSTIPTTDETGDQTPTDTKLTDSPSPGI